MSKDDPCGRTVAGEQPVACSPNRMAQPSAITDLAAAKAEIDRLQGALAEVHARERVLSTELQHRVRNMLAMIRSIARQSWEEGGSQEEYAQHLQGRLDAIARYQARIGLGRAFGTDVEDMLRDELLQTHLLDGPRCRISGPPVLLYDKQAELFGLAIHELAINAIKFGAFAQGGSLTAQWWVEDAGVRFRWSESGVAVASPAPRPSGFGRRLILEALPYELDAATAIDLEPGRVVCSIILPLPQVARAVPSYPGSAAEESSPLPDDGKTP